MEELCEVAYMSCRHYIALSYTYIIEMLYIALSCTYIIEMLSVTFVYANKRLILNGQELQSGVWT
jgi:hypothetical protein